MSGLRVAIVGCGLIGSKRATALDSTDELVGCYDVDTGAASRLANAAGGQACSSFEELLDLAPEAVVIATPHDMLSSCAERAVDAGSDVLLEKPAGISAAQIERLLEAQLRSGRIIKVGFNHRFHPAISRLHEELGSGRHGEVMYLRACYGHGGRVGYENEWRADPAKAGGGELVDQGTHLLDLAHHLIGPLQLHSGLLRTHFWDVPIEDNAALILGDAGDRRAPWALLHVSWTEWKNSFSLEVYCKGAKLAVNGLSGSYGPQRLTIYRMSPELGPPSVEELRFPSVDESWRAEWGNFREAVELRDADVLSGSLLDARYVWTQIEAAYADSDYDVPSSPAPLPELRA